MKIKRVFSIKKTRGELLVSEYDTNHIVNVKGKCSSLRQAADLKEIRSLKESVGGDDDYEVYKKLYNKDEKLAKWFHTLIFRVKLRETYSSNY